MTNELLLGYETNTGNRIDIPLFHTVITGITRHGKSETMSALAQRAHQHGQTILIFDVKNPPDYQTISTNQLPIYLEKHTDPTTLKGLLENQSGMGLNFQFSELIKMYEPGDTYHDMLSRMQNAIESDVHPVEEDKLRVLIHLLENLTAELDTVDISSELELAAGEINVMDLHEVSDSIQQLAIAGTVKQILTNHQDVIVVLDEAHNFIPQRKQPPARDPLVQLIREGAANNNWLWISDQTITGVDKDPLKQVGVWVLGKQREKNEAKRVLDQIPGSTSYTSSDVMTLDKGHFIVALDDAQPHVYVQPDWIDADTARSIATGDQTIESLEPNEPEESDMDEELQAKETELQQREQRISELEEQLADKQREIESLENKIDELFSTDEEGVEGERVGGVDEERVREILFDVIEEFEVPESVTVDKKHSKIVIRHFVDPLEIDTDSKLGKVAYLYANGEIPENKWFTTGDVQSIVDKHGWDTTITRTDVLTELTRMGFFEMRFTDRREYRMVMSPSKAREAGYLVVEEEVSA